MISQVSFCTYVDFIVFELTSSVRNCLLSVFLTDVVFLNFFSSNWESFPTEWEHNVGNLSLEVVEQGWSGILIDCCLWD